jgi:uncharacterized protein (DUF433 family)
MSNMPPVPGHPRVSIDEHTLVGKPRITGTRIGVDLILSDLAAGATIEWLLEPYPFLKEEDIRAALAYASEAVAARADSQPIAAE